jgi:hypothetical protein
MLVLRKMASLSLIISLLLITGCGGGSGGSDSPVEGLKAPKKVSAVEAKD